VLVAVLTAVARLVMPTVVPTVVPTALMHQNKAIAIAATALASNLCGVLDLLSARADKRLFPIPLTLYLSLLTLGPMRDFRVDSDAMNNKAADTRSRALSRAYSPGKIARYFSLSYTTSTEPPRRQRHSIRMATGLAKTGMGSADCD
jgi:hypothetical protein